MCGYATLNAAAVAIAASAAVPPAASCAAPAYDAAACGDVTAHRVPIAEPRAPSGSKLRAISTRSIALVLPGAHVVARSVYDDRIVWVLPPDRLAAFRRAGAVIEEDKRTTTLAHATVGAAP